MFRFSARRATLAVFARRAALAVSARRASAVVSARRAMLIALPLLCLAGGPAHAHAILEESQPPDRGRVAAGIVAFKLRFNARIDRVRSRLTLTGPGGIKTIPPIQPESAPDIVATTAGLAPGAYVLRWQVLAVDGHITRGDVAFTVTER